MARMIDFPYTKRDGRHGGMPPGLSCKAGVTEKTRLVPMPRARIKMKTTANEGEVTLPGESC